MVKPQCLTLVLDNKWEKNQLMILNVMSLCESRKHFSSYFVSKLNGTAGTDLVTVKFVPYLSHFGVLSVAEILKAKLREK
mmetsp:Transcript_30898/g.35189  ORF Transcript_30898/g.35189 Transcript_30898/m.35189 type:complete len:80 (-) Transcript_30898:221-460(-)